MRSKMALSRPSCVISIFLSAGSREMCARTSSGLECSAFCSTLRTVCSHACGTEWLWCTPTLVDRLTTAWKKPASAVSPLRRGPASFLGGHARHAPSKQSCAIGNVGLLAGASSLAARKSAHSAAFIVRAPCRKTPSRCAGAYASKTSRSETKFCRSSVKSTRSHVGKPGRLESSSDPHTSSMPCSACTLSPSTGGRSTAVGR
mmetsp:Transcript_62960/g.187340  ORF Transcript_62960/g.187340 Transcript_62960/m.187340 type:complete len:203 (+) Transcript_62960:349-957(+)